MNGRSLDCGFRSSRWLSLVGVLTLCSSVEAQRPSLLEGAIFPQISPNGARIAFSYQGAIWTVPRVGGTMLQLTNAPGFDSWPTWSPNGKRIAFIRGRGAFSGSVRIVDSELGVERELPGNVVANGKLCFSPDGMRLLSLFRRPGGVYSLCWCEIDTGELGKELRPELWGLCYSLSPDGKSLALVTTQDIRGEQGGNHGPQCDIWRMSADGGTPEQVLRFPGRVYDVAWSADQTALLLVSNLGGVHNDLWQLPFDGLLRAARKLTFGQADEDGPSVDREGRYLAFSDNHRGPTTLLVRDLVSGLDAPVYVVDRDHGRKTGSLQIAVTDAERQQRTTARVSVKRQGGKYYAPPASLYRLKREEMHFYCSGETSFEVPAGDYLVTVARGPEYPVVRRECHVLAGESTSVEIGIRRWTHQRDEGWVSGESHIHANYGYGQWYNSPQTMLAQSSGEDLVVSHFMVANSEADGVFDREYFRGQVDPLSSEETILFWNQEFRSTIWGHMTLLNLKQLVEPIFTGFAHTTNPHDYPTNADIADLTHDQDGHVNYTHPARNVQDPYLSAYSAKALPLDVALGKVDSIDVMGSDHVATMSIWYRLLNCGFRVSASAGTDCFLNRVRSRLPGQDRAYVFVEGPVTYDKWIKSLRRGRSFVTNGPMLRLTANDQMIGDTIRLGEPGVIEVQTRVESQYPIDRYEIVLNGNVVETSSDARPLGKTLTWQIPVARSGWLGFRAGGPPHPDQPSGAVFAHTGPIYIEVAGQPVEARKDAAYFVNWIDRLRRDIRRRNRVPSRHQVHVETQMADARAIFNQLLVPTDR